MITDPNTLNVTWYVDVAGSPTAYSMANLDNMDANWRHYAFTYDEMTGTATFYVDGIAVDSFDGPDNAPLVIVASTPVELGILMDFATAGQGTLDEVRLSGTALEPSGFLAPEPSNALLVGLGLVALAARRRRHH